MTRALIIGGGGMVGQKLVHRLLRLGLPGHPDLDVTLFDLGFQNHPVQGVKQITGNVTDMRAMDRLAAAKFDMIFYLASIVSGRPKRISTKAGRPTCCPPGLFSKLCAPRTLPAVEPMFRVSCSHHPSQFLAAHIRTKSRMSFCRHPDELWRAKGYLRTDAQ